MFRTCCLVALMACGGGAVASPRAVASAPSLPSQFWDHWGDGRAEIAGYELKTPRYGEIREGRATLISVTEDFTHRQRVKTDGGHPDEYPVFKLNLVSDFQTGIYDYNVMTSTFFRIDSQGTLTEPVKVSMSMQEWCGHVYEQVVPTEDELTWTSHSYFDGEADSEVDLGRNPKGIVLDGMPVLVRGVLGEMVKRGESLEAPALRTLVQGRLTHKPPAWTTVKISRAAEPSRVKVPAGTFDVEVWTTEVADGATTTWHVEAPWPHRLVGWSSSNGEEAKLLGVERLPYWRQHNNGDEALLSNIGHPVPRNSAQP